MNELERLRSENTDLKKFLHRFRCWHEDEQDDEGEEIDLRDLAREASELEAAME